MYRNSFQPINNYSLYSSHIPNHHILPLHNNLFKNAQQANTQSNMKKLHSKTEQNKQYLTLVSKEKRKQKRHLLKSSKKSVIKKLHSITLGGDKKNTQSFVSTSKSSKSSFCQSCVNFSQKDQIPIQQTMLVNPANVHPIPMVYRCESPILIERPKNQNINKIITQKLHIDNQSNKPIIKIMRNPTFIVKQRKVQNIKENFIKNRASSVGRIYFSVGNSLDKKQPFNDNKQKNQLTPRFDQKCQSNRKKQRRNAGFIRSASAPKVFLPFNPNQQQQMTTYPNNSSYKSQKQNEINKCLQKMSSIRKQIDELQYFLRERLQTSQLKHKYLYNSSKCPLSNNKVSQNKNQLSFSNIYTNDRREQNYGKHFIPTDNFDKLYNVQSKKVNNHEAQVLNQIQASSLNTSLVQSKLTNYNSQSIQMPLTINKNPNHLAISNNKIYELKYPSSLASSNIQKQIIAQLSSKNYKNGKNNQQNIFYHKNSINSFR